MIRGGPIALLLAAACAGPGSRAPVDPVFYEPRDVGSEAGYDPLASSLQYVLDSVQIPAFGTHDYDEHLGIVVDDLASPFHAISEEGGARRFVNAEIFPIDPHRLHDAYAVLPNVGLHTFGGGLLYRKNAEWFEAHGVAAPYVVSASLAMVSEVLAEAIEKPVTTDTDEIADVYLFRPLGLWLFSDDDRARWIRRELDPVDWPSQLMWSVQDGEFANTGLSYVVRPGDATGTRPFLLMGLTTLIGLSHPLGGGDAISWGVGGTTVSTEPVEARVSGGLYYDRDRSLLASLLLNAGEEYAVRANVYPGAWLPEGLGLFAALTDDGEVAAGLQYRLPVGVAR